MYLEPPFDPCEEPGPEREPDAWRSSSGQFVRAASGAFSSNTERALRSDLAIYAEWCAEHGERPLPAKPETVAAFVDAKAEIRAPATVRRYVTSLVIAHRAFGLEKTLKSPAGAACAQAHAPQEGAAPGPGDGADMAAAPAPAGGCGRQVDRRPQPRAARRRLRRDAPQSGIGTALQVPDLLEELQGDGSLLVRRSKTDGEGRGEIVWVGRDSVRLVRAWLDRGGIAEGMMFRSVGKGGRIGERLHPCQVPRIFKAMAREAGLPEAVAAGLSGHSTRGSVRPRTWSPPASNCRRSSTPGGGSPPRW